MMALFITGILVFTGKLLDFACKAAWGITKGVLFVMEILEVPDGRHICLG